MTAKVIDLAAYRRAKEPAPVERKQARYCDPANERRGHRYARGLTTKEIAARGRAQIKADTKTGEIPKGTKVSVRYESFSGGSAIRVEITALPAGFPLLNPERIAWDCENPHAYPGDAPDRYTPEATVLLNWITRIFKAYHRDNSDSMTDYFDVNFYGGDAQFAWKLEKAARENGGKVGA